MPPVAVLSDVPGARGVREGRSAVGRGHDAVRGGTRWLIGAAVAALGAGGCATFWDDVTSRDFEVRALFVKDDPLVVLRDSKDGDKRARAYAALKEPRRSGGGDRDQEFVLELLATAVKSEAQYYPRLQAVRKLGEFADPRAVPALVEAYYNASAFGPENATVLRCQVLTALGEVGHPAGAELLVRVLRQGPVEGPEEDRRRALDERIAAARALKRFPQVPSAEALVHVLRTEKDVALRVTAHESLQACTGKQLPADAETWGAFVEQEKGKGDALAGGKRKGVMELIQAGFWTSP